MGKVVRQGQRPVFGVDVNKPMDKVEVRRESWRRSSRKYRATQARKRAQETLFSEETSMTGYATKQEAWDDGYDAGVAQGKHSASQPPFGDAMHAINEDCHPGPLDASQPPSGEPCSIEPAFSLHEYAVDYCETHDQPASECPRTPDIKAEMAALRSGTLEPAVDDFGNEYLARRASQPPSGDAPRRIFAFGEWWTNAQPPSGDAPDLREAAQSLVDWVDDTTPHSRQAAFGTLLDRIEWLRAALAASAPPERREA